MVRRLRLATILGVLALFATLLPGMASAAPRPDSYVLPGDAVFPEGIAFQQNTGYFYVSSTTDGTIFRGDVKEPQAEVFLPGGQDGRTSATGMKVDREGRLFISGAGTGKVFVYDTATKALLASFDNDLAGTFVNDVALSRGSAYFTDSVAPYIYRVAPGSNGTWTYERWLDFTGTPFVYQPGFNANGIAATPDGRYLIVVQSNTGKLFRIDIATRAVSQIDLGGATVTNGDGIVLQGHRLYVVRNAQALIVEIRLSGDLLSGTVVSSTTDPSLAYPTTAAIARGRMLLVNSQFNKRGPGLTPDLPFTVSSIRVP